MNIARITSALPTLILIWVVSTVSFAFADGDWWRGMQQWIAGSDTRADSSAEIRDRLRGNIEFSFSELSKEGAFDRDPSIRLELPPAWQAVRQHGLEAAVILDAWEFALNRAAEHVLPTMRAHWIKALNATRFESVTGSSALPGAALSAHFKSQVELALRERLESISVSILRAEGLAVYPQKLAMRYPDAALPDGSLAEMSRWIGVQASDAVFSYLADEELRAQSRLPVDEYYTALPRPVNR